jgi:hypothetical protein
MNKKIRINKKELADWIRDFGTGGVMLSISEPHARSGYLNLEQWHMEPIVSYIIELASKQVFGKHKRFEALQGVMVCESPMSRPHFHIVFKKPEGMDRARFKDKLEKLATKLCDESFEFNLSNSTLPDGLKKVLATPCYDNFVKATDAHENSGSYLTKEYAHYYLLNGRKLVMEDSKINLFVDFYNRNSEVFFH